MKQIPNASADGVVVIGGGIVGLSSALELAQRGRAVTVIDRGPIDGGCALGSAGHLVPSHVVPLAEPGALRMAFNGLIRRDGAVSVSWSADPAFWRWVLRFVRSCTARSVSTAAPALTELARLSDAIWTAWLAESAVPVTRVGLLDVYADAKPFAAAARHAEELRRWGVPVEILDGDATMAMEPALIGPVSGAVYLPDDRSIPPEPALSDLVERVTAAGVTLLANREVLGLDTRGGLVTRLRTSSGDVDTTELVLAAGAWTGRLARQLGERVPVIAGRGLSMTVDRPASGPVRPLLLGEDHVAVAPMGDVLRLSAWFQLNNFDTAISRERIARLERIARRRIRLDDTLTVRRRSAGLRPVTPDGVPIIGRSARWRNVTIAAGHSMTGLTHGPGTGRLVAQLVCGETPDIALDRFSPSRF
jgi:D-amino-acid dehydrogenase